MLQPSKITVTNEEIVERVMRFGIEAKCGIPPEKWWETAKAQIVNNKQHSQQRTICYFKTLKEWFDNTVDVKYMLIRGEYSRLVRVTDFDDLQKYKIIEWNSREIPVVVPI